MGTKLNYIEGGSGGNDINNSDIGRLNSYIGQKIADILIGKSENLSQMLCDYEHNSYTPNILDIIEKYKDDIPFDKYIEIALSFNSFKGFNGEDLLKYFCIIPFNEKFPVGLLHEDFLRIILGEDKLKEIEEQKISHDELIGLLSEEQKKSDIADKYYNYLRDKNGPLCLDFLGIKNKILKLGEYHNSRALDVNFTNIESFDELQKKEISDLLFQNKLYKSLLKNFPDYLDKDNQLKIAKQECKDGGYIRDYPEKLSVFNKISGYEMLDIMLDLQDTNDSIGAIMYNMKYFIKHGATIQGIMNKLYEKGILWAKSGTWEYFVGSMLDTWDKGQQYLQNILHDITLTPEQQDEIFLAVVDAKGFVSASILLHCLKDANWNKIIERVIKKGENKDFEYMKKIYRGDINPLGFDGEELGKFKEAFKPYISVPKI